MTYKAPHSAEREYQTAFNAQPLDSSDFILLSLGYFERKCKELSDPKFTNEIKEIREKICEIQKYYIDLNYPHAIILILSITNCSSRIVAPEIRELIKRRHLKLIDKPMKNNSRRFFETQLALTLSKDTPKEEYVIIDKLKEVFKTFPTKDSVAFNLPDKVDSIKDIFEVFLNLALIETSLKRHLKNGSPLRNSKDKSEKILDQCSSLNPGIMRSIT